MIYTSDEETLFRKWSRKRDVDTQEWQKELARLIAMSSNHLANAAIEGAATLRQWIKGLMQEAKNNCLRRQWSQEKVLFRDHDGKALCDE